MSVSRHCFRLPSALVLACSPILPTEDTGPWDLGLEKSGPLVVTATKQVP
jgi:hypothetical protein